MSLAKKDLTDIRSLMLEVLDIAVTPRLDSLESGQDEMRTTLEEHGKVLAEHSVILAEHGKILIDHGQKLTSLQSGQTETNRRLTSVEETLATVAGEVTALRNDVVALYGTTKQKLARNLTGKAFSKLTTNDQIQALHTGVLALAKHQGLTLS